MLLNAYFPYSENLRKFNSTIFAKYMMIITKNIRYNFGERNAHKSGYKWIWKNWATSF